MSGRESSGAHGRAEHKNPRIFAPHDPARRRVRVPPRIEGRSRLRGRPAPGWLAVRLVSIPAHSEMAGEPSEWGGAVVVVEAGEVELEC
jgi:hypothetical protein